MIAIVGGGLSGCLLALRLAALENPPEFVLIESGTEPGGNHTWSFHESDISESSIQWIEPLIEHRWNGQEVRFLDFNRTFDVPYYTLTSSRLSSIVQKTLGSRLILGEKVLSMDSRSVTLEDGKRIEARVVFDARGPSDSHEQTCGYQKFVGIELELTEPHQLKFPVIMDASVAQADGYRFFYLLPESPTRILVEDTRYGNHPEIDVSEFAREIEGYCAMQGWSIARILRKEVAALPIPFQRQTFDFREGEAISIGVRGGYFHPTTGYSVPWSIAVAEAVAQQVSKTSEWNLVEIALALVPIQKHLRQQARFFTLLNKLLFLAAEPERRWKIFDRFYRLDQGLIFRFYSGNLRRWDQIRLLVGKPPVPILEALKCSLGLKAIPG